MSTITVNKKELQKLIRETLEDVFNDKKDFIGDAVVEAMENVGLGRAIEEGRTGEYIDLVSLRKNLLLKSHVLNENSN